jgi:hypothetical protein
MEETGLLGAIGPHKAHAHVVDAFEKVKDAAARRKRTYSRTSRTIHETISSDGDGDLAACIAQATPSNAREYLDCTDDFDAP